MNWLLEKIFGNKQEKKGKEEAGIKEGRKVSIKLNDAQTLLEREKEQKFSDFYEECAEISKKIQAGLPNLKSKLTELGNKELTDEAKQHKNIAQQMRENFSQRAPAIIDGISLPSENSYPAFAKYHLEVMNAMALLTKITSDNRYLLYFFKKDFEELGKGIKVLCETADKLAEKLKEFAPENEKIENAERKIRETEGMRNEVSETTVQTGKLDKQLEAERENERKLSEELQSKNLEGLEAALEDTKKNLLLEEMHLKEELMQLERPFRKYEKIVSDKKELFALKKYLSNLKEALSEDGKDYPQLKSLLGSLKKAIQEGKIEGSDKLNAIEKILNGSLNAKTDAIEKLMKREEMLLADLKPLQKLKFDSESAKGRKLGTEKDLQMKKSKITDAENKISSGTKELETLLSEISGNEIKIEA